MVISFKVREFPFSHVTCHFFDLPCLDVTGVFKKFLLTYEERKRNYTRQGQKLAQPDAFDKEGSKYLGRGHEERYNHQVVILFPVGT